MKDIGKEGQGASFAQASAKVMGAVAGSLSQVDLKGLAGNVEKNLKGVAEGLKGTGESVGEGLKGVGDSLKGLFK